MQQRNWNAHVWLSGHPQEHLCTGDLDAVINQLVFRSQGDLGQFVDNRDLFIRGGRDND